MYPSENSRATAATAPVGCGGEASRESIEQLMTYKQAADLAGVTDRTVWTLVREGHLPAVRFGRSVRIDPADLRTFIKRAKRRGMCHAN